jgi:hypothetical protein
MKFDKFRARHSVFMKSGNLDLFVALLLHSNLMLKKSSSTQHQINRTFSPPPPHLMDFGLESGCATLCSTVTMQIDYCVGSFTLRGDRYFWAKINFRFLHE